MAHYQNQIKDIVTIAKKENYSRIMILNGNDILNRKFEPIITRQVAKFSEDPESCQLWMLEIFVTSPREIATTKFDLDEYLLMYDDIVKES